MKRIIPTFFLLGFAILLMSGCIAPPRAEFRPPEGFVFSNYKAPLLVDYDNAKVSTQRGDASASAFHDILITGMSFGWGDCSTDAAVKDGRLNRIGAADYEYLSFCRIFGKTTVHVYEVPAAKK
jgi:hypothetical protein